jgi:hypothetical protein
MIADRKRKNIITGNRFFEVCHELEIPYAKTDYIGESGCTAQMPIVLTHNGGYNVRNAPGDSVAITSLGIASFLDMPPIVRWFCLNNASDRPMTESIPLGVENWCIPDCGKGSEHYTLGSLEHENPGEQVVLGIEDCWEKLTTETCHKSPSVMLCWRTDTNPYERGLAQLVLAPMPWTKWYPANVNDPNRMEPRDFINELFEHQFVACPEGNGIDCHRVWEALYVCTCPIVKRNKVWERFSELFPIWIVDSWDEVTPPAMYRQWELFSISFRHHFVSPHLSMATWRRRLRHARDAARSYT